MWGFVALGGLLVVVIGNLLRARRTGNRSCLGHFFVPAGEMTRPEWVLNRTGIGVFALGVLAALIL